MIPAVAPIAVATAHPEQENDDRDHHVMRSERIHAGKCPSCGTQLYKLKKPHRLGGLLNKKGTSQPKPLTIEGTVLRGQCIRCMGTGATSPQEEDAALAEALLLSEIEYTQSHQDEVDDERPLGDVGACSHSSVSSVGEDEQGAEAVPGELHQSGAPSEEEDQPSIKSETKEGQIEIEIGSDPPACKAEKQAQEEIATKQDEEDAISDTFKNEASIESPGKRSSEKDSSATDKGLEAENEDPHTVPEHTKKQATEPEKAHSHEEDDASDEEQDVEIESSESLEIVETLEEPGGDALPTIAAIPVAAVIPEAKALDTATYNGPLNGLGARHGEGELKWSNGDRYEGNFWNGVREGSGTLFFANGGEYVGEWENNKMHGEGTQRFVNGDVYTGQFVRGKRSGQGRCYFANGDLYTGSWHDDQLNGYGTYYYNKGQSFQGIFFNNKRQGKGKYQYVDGKVDVNWYANGTKSGDGVRWSANRRKVWKVSENGRYKKRISLEQADDFVRNMGG